MKLFYDKRRSDPVYYVQQGYRNAQGKPTTKNIRILGRHSELLKITDDPVSYCREQVRLMNEEYRVGRTSLQMEIDFNEKVKDTDDEYSKSDQLNVGYFYLQLIYEKLRVGDFFKLVTRKRKITESFVRIYCSSIRSGM